MYHHQGYCQTSVWTNEIALERKRDTEWTMDKADQLVFSKIIVLSAFNLFSIIKQGNFSCEYTRAGRWREEMSYTNNNSEFRLKNADISPFQIANIRIELNSWITIVGAWIFEFQPAVTNYTDGSGSISSSRTSVYDHESLQVNLIQIHWYAGFMEFVFMDFTLNWVAIKWRARFSICSFRKRHILFDWFKNRQLRWGIDIELELFLWFISSYWILW